MDSFAGSGTIGHAVLAQNKADGGNRRFIMIEMDEGISHDVTAQRLRKAIEGYGDTPGTGGGFRYCTLGKPLFDEHGNIAESVKFTDLAAHIFFTETGVPIPKRPRKINGTHPKRPHPGPLPEGEGEYCPLLGVHNGKAIYLLFNGVLGDKRPRNGNVLTRAVVNSLPKHDGLKVVYGEACRLSPPTLTRLGIMFKQLPYEVKTQ